MANALHSKQTVADGVHIAHSLEFADETARLAYAATAADVGRVSLQLDTKQFWILTDDSPLSWSPIDGAGSHVLSGIFLWGDDSVSVTTTPRYLTPNYDDGIAQTWPIEFRIPVSATVKHMRVRHTVAGTGAATLTYTLRVNGVDSTLVVSMSNTAQDGSDLVHTVAVSAGDILTVRVDKTAGTTKTPSGVTCTVELGA